MIATLSENGSGATPSNRVFLRAPIACAQPYDKAAYRKRHLVENFFEKLKRFRRIATRYDKLARTFFGFVCLATVVTFKR